MSLYKIDHLVVGCNNLHLGTEYVQNLLQLKLSDIGYHKKIGTHNRVLKIGGMYLEVISLDPLSNINKKNSFFGLSNSFVQQEIIKKPRLISFVISSNEDIKSRFHCQKTYMERGHYKWSFRRPDHKKIDKNIFPYVDSFPSLITWLSKPPILGMKNNSLFFDELNIEINEEQNFYKEFLKKFNLKEKINFINSEKKELYKHPKLTAKIINKDDGKEFIIS